MRLTRHVRTRRLPERVKQVRRDSDDARVHRREVVPCRVYRQKWHMCGLVHSDDFVFAGPYEHLANVATHMGHAATVQNVRNELRVLNSSIKWGQAVSLTKATAETDKLIGEVCLTPRQTVATPAIHESRENGRRRSALSNPAPDGGQPCEPALVNPVRVGGRGGRGVEFETPRR